MKIKSALTLEGKIQQVALQSEEQAIAEHHHQFTPQLDDFYMWYVRATEKVAVKPPTVDAAIVTGMQAMHWANYRAEENFRMRTTV